MRFNEDFGTLEFYTGDEWRIVNSIKDTGNRGRGVFAGGSIVVIDEQRYKFINISSGGNAQYFGDLTSFFRKWQSGNNVQILFKRYYAGGLQNPRVITILIMLL